MADGAWVGAANGSKRGKVYFLNDPEKIQTLFGIHSCNFPPAIIHQAAYIRLTMRATDACEVLDFRIRVVQKLHKIIPICFSKRRVG